MLPTNQSLEISLDRNHYHRRRHRASPRYRALHLRFQEPDQSFEKACGCVRFQLPTARRWLLHRFSRDLFQLLGQWRR